MIQKLNVRYIIIEKFIFFYNYVKQIVLDLLNVRCT